MHFIWKVESIHGLKTNYLNSLSKQFVIIQDQSLLSVFKDDHWIKQHDSRYVTGLKAHDLLKFFALTTY